MSLIYLGKEIYDWLNNCKKQSNTITKQKQI